MLYYNSRIWARHGNAVTFSPVAGWPSAGFSLGFGRILTYGTTANTKFVLIDPDGTRHYLGAGAASTQGTYQTTDGTHITYVGNALTGGTLYYPDLTKVTIEIRNNRLLPVQITDANGNYIQIAYKYGAASPLAIDYVTDTKARNIQFQYDGSGKLTSITAPGFGGTSQNPVTRTVVQFDYESRTPSYNFSGLTVENVPTGPVQALRHLYFPATAIGNLFSYSDYGMVYNISRRRQMTIDGSGVISDGVESASVAFNYPTSGSTLLADAPAFSQRTESPGGAFNYSTSVDSVAQTMTFSVTRPDSSTLHLTRSTNAASASNGRLIQSEVKSGSTSFAKVVTGYTTDGGGSTVVQSVTNYDETGTPTKVDSDYDQYGNVTNKREYGLQIGGTWQVRRRTNYTYKTDSTYINAYLRNLVMEVKVYDAHENTSDADDVLISKRAFTYDDYASTGGIATYPEPTKPAHISTYNTTYTLRGNVTGTTEWSDIVADVSVTRLRKYDIFGNVLHEQLSCCKQQVFTYKATDYWTEPQQVTKGDPAGLNVASSFKYDFNTDLVKEQGDLIDGKMENKVTCQYDAALRPTLITWPTEATQTITYNDAAMTTSSTKTGLGTTTVTYDGWRRVVQVVDQNNGQVNTSYDSMERVSSRTNPFTAGGQPGPQTTYQYDPLGRVTVETLPGGNTLQNTYSGSVTSTDQVGRKTRRENDGLGRLVKVTEQDATGALTQETSYSYNLLNNLIQVNQGNQTRSYKYDDLGRLLYERIPEQTATISDGTGGYWTTKYTYTFFHAVETRTDARGVVTTYAYDGLNRLQTISYNTTNAPGVAATPGVTYTYDTAATSVNKGKLQSVSVGSNQESYNYDSYKRLYSVMRTIDGINYTIGYGYNTASQRSQITYPSGRVLNLNRDATGRLSSLQVPADGSNPEMTYLSSIGYNTAGQVTGFTLGNGVVEAYGYDTQRMQLTTHTAIKGGTTLMSLTHSFQATAGQMGAGTTAGNADQLMTVSGTIGGQTESASHTYDLLGRLATSSQITNGSSAQRRFAYDRWGNRTGMWDATSGGNQIQSVVLQQGGGVPTNRLTSVTTSGVTKNYTYDSAGNVTNDGTHTYVYDAENRLVSVDSGAYTYSYDHQNRRLKKAGSGAATHYLWEGSQVIAEHNGSTGSQQVAYYYVGSRLISKDENGQTRYFLSDRLGARLVLDLSGNIIGRQGHLPFGEEIGASGEVDKHRFTSYERDAESGQDYAINRYYGLSTGRFMSIDPLLNQGFRAKASVDQTWNNIANNADPAITYEQSNRTGMDYTISQHNRITSGGIPAIDSIANMARIKKSNRCERNNETPSDDEFTENPQYWNGYSYTMNDPINWTDPLGLCRNPIAFRQCIKLSVPKCARLVLPKAVAICVAAVIVACYARWCEEIGGRSFGGILD